MGADVSNHLSANVQPGRRGINARQWFAILLASTEVFAVPREEHALVHQGTGVLPVQRQHVKGIVKMVEHVFTTPSNVLAHRDFMDKTAPKDLVLSM